MHVISKRRLREFWLVYDQAEEPLKVWYKLMENNNSITLQELRNTFQTADPVDIYTVFNIRGGKCRLAAKMEYTHQKCSHLSITNFILKLFVNRPYKLPYKLKKL